MKRFLLDACGSHCSPLSLALKYQALQSLALRQRSRLLVALWCVFLVGQLLMRKRHCSLQLCIGSESYNTKLVRPGGKGAGGGRGGGELISWEDVHLHEQEHVTISHIGGFEYAQPAHSGKCCHGYRVARALERAQPGPMQMWKGILLLTGSWTRQCFLIGQGCPGLE